MTIDTRDITVRDEINPLMSAEYTSILEEIKIRINDARHRVALAANSEQISYIGILELSSTKRKHGEINLCRRCLRILV